ncbi:hypothetical protein [Kineococcus sp. SYSU DK003]|uniref:hypothetical protein n=1 Tax=Kineococcus sp. SYSU DK003 TaxID=3383124 RepID=UPI003D7D104E
MSRNRIGRGVLRAELTSDLEGARLVLRDDVGIVNVLKVRRDRVPEVRAALDDAIIDQNCVLQITTDEGQAQTWGQFQGCHHAVATALVLMASDGHARHAVVRAVVERPAGARGMGRGSEQLGEELARLEASRAPTWWERQPL